MQCAAVVSFPCSLVLCSILRYLDGEVMESTNIQLFGTSRDTSQSQLLKHLPIHRFRLQLPGTPLRTM